MTHKHTSFSLVLALGLIACTDPPLAPVEESDHPIDKLFAPLGELSIQPAKRVEGAARAPVTTGDYQCTDVPIDEVRHYDQLLGQLNTGDILWPGALLRGDSVHSGQLTPITLARAPLTFSVSLESLGSGKRSATLATPNLSSYRDAVGEILAQSLSGSTAARISADVEEVSSEEQLSLALGADVSAPLVASVKAGFDFRDSTKRSRFVVKYFQLYYTVDVDPPDLPHDFFAPEVTADDVASVISPESPPVYVSSIGYGRQVVFTFESDLSKSELAAALDFVYKGGTEVSGSVSLTHQEVLSRTHTTAFILGGDGGEAASVAIGSYDQLKTFIGRGGNYSKDSPGAAIAYKLSYVRDHVPVRISYASEYTQRTCSRITQRVRVVFERIKADAAGDDPGTDLEIYGSVAVKSQEIKSLAAWTSAQYKTIAEGTSFPSSGVISEAILPVKPAAGESIDIITSLWEHDGTFDDNFGANLHHVAPFEAGWRRTLQLQQSEGDQRITLEISLTPVP